MKVVLIEFSTNAISWALTNLIDYLLYMIPKLWIPYLGEFHYFEIITSFGAWFIVKSPIYVTLLCLILIFHELSRIFWENFWRAPSSWWSSSILSFRCLPQLSKIIHWVYYLAWLGYSDFSSFKIVFFFFFPYLKYQDDGFLCSIVNNG